MICIIPARGGSTRLPGKNMVDFFGRPIIDWVIETAWKSELFSSVIVSTDDEEIYQHAKLKAYPMMRPDWLCGDGPEDEVLKHVMDSRDATVACRIYPFAVLLTAERLRRGRDEYMGGFADAVLECQQYAHPPQRGFTLVGGSGRYLKKENVEKRTQDLTPVYHDAGTYCFTTREALDKPTGERDKRWIVVGEMEAQDIDTAEDLEMAKLKFLRRHL